MRPLALLAAIALSAPARPGTPAGPVVVELFTSEGCSSCPPADALLASLSREGVGDVRVVALSEHVDYWDGPAWRDPFSSREMTRRQLAYERTLGVDSAYTPQAVVNGEAQVVGSDGPALRAAVLRAARRQMGSLTLRRTPAGLAVEGAWAGGRASVLVALLEDGVQSAVRGGENAGRTLRHEGVVRSLAEMGAGDGSFRGEIALPAPPGPGAFRVLALAQAGRGGRILASGELPGPYAADP
ncbi:MAG TPA: DUF1223 domain-containing protein [Anaeromyxobacter sp.]|nr:DUF1223 domain-containing protein [Anaeromyxobacter sp.]